MSTSPKYSLSLNFHLQTLYAALLFYVRATSPDPLILLELIKIHKTKNYFSLYFLHINLVKKHFKGKSDDLI